MHLILCSAVDLKKYTMELSCGRAELMYLVVRRSAINKENRAKLKIVHTSGARSFQRARALLEKMEVLQLQHESEGKSYTEVEIFAEVLGTKAVTCEV
ncbi:hypothetical protein CJ030_MR5G023513 [Morella rubra]|uniref:Uncharacterized protein n=1 Tax=Morella rubra TaxID=262757 RepID=A0A6A1VI66_9ROSI|nr:hypothetical protein CJ030_MR5G023513 [Morella rubra]